MPKLIHSEETSSRDGDEDSPPTKITKTTSICEYCNKTFTSRGIPLHQKKCRKKLAHDHAEAKKTRAYKFCILNESIHEEILSFLSNQTLTKMQMITGDRYEGCEPELAKICCKCENDSFTNETAWCGQCFQRLRGNPTFVTKKGKEWLRHLVKVRTRRDEAEAAKSRRNELYYFLVNRAPTLARFVKACRYKDLAMKDKGRWCPRFDNLEAVCHDGSVLLLDAIACKDFIKNGIGSVEDVVKHIQQN